MSHQNTFGPHLMLDLNQCNVSQLNSIDTCIHFLNKLPDLIGMTKLTQPYAFPYHGIEEDDQGITGTVIIAESHLSIHTFPLKEFAFIDIFSCRPFDTDVAKKFCVDLFESKKVTAHLIMRGKEFPQKRTIADLPI